MYGIGLSKLAQNKENRDGPSENGKWRIDFLKIQAPDFYCIKLRRREIYNCITT